jgi:hypothetical protein
MQPVTRNTLPHLAAVAGRREGTVTSVAINLHDGHPRRASAAGTQRSGTGQSRFPRNLGAAPAVVMTATSY